MNVLLLTCPHRKYYYKAVATIFDWGGGGGGGKAMKRAPEAQVVTRVWRNALQEIRDFKIRDATAVRRGRK